MISIRAIFDGKVFIPEEPVNLPRDARCKIVLDGAVKGRPVKVREKKSGGKLDAFLAKGPVRGPWPADFSTEVDSYVYGLAKRARGRGKAATGSRARKG